MTHAAGSIPSHPLLQPRHLRFERFCTGVGCSSACGGEAYGSVKSIFFEAWSVLTNLFSLKHKIQDKKNTKIKGFFCLVMLLQ